MIEKPDNLLRLVSLSKRERLPNTRRQKEKKQMPPDPPSEETMLRLNAIVKEAPFCFHFHEKENDLL